jgi:sugar/nucleoside kinase (ribokinase family)
LVPQIHDHLSELLRRSKSNGSITVVNTVFDFRNQKKAPDKPWPLVDNESDYRLIDLLIMDHEEALRISGEKTIEAATTFYENSGLQSFIITNGAKDLVAYSNGEVFRARGTFSYPTSGRVRARLRDDHSSKGDTTGCGDNFVGAMIASIAMQMKDGKKGRLDLSEAVSWGVAAGGNCCFIVGGTYLDKMPGDLGQKIQNIRQDYMLQIQED